MFNQQVNLLYGTVHVRHEALRLAVQHLATLGNLGHDFGQAPGVVTGFARAFEDFILHGKKPVEQPGPEKVAAE